MCYKLIMWPTACALHTRLTRHALAVRQVPHTCTDAHQMIGAIAQCIAGVADNARVDVHFEWTHIRRILHDPIRHIQLITACNAAGRLAHRPVTLSTHGHIMIVLISANAHESTCTMQHITTVAHELLVFIVQQHRFAVIVHCAVFDALCRVAHCKGVQYDV